jgi:hypothetical protein
MSWWDIIPLLFSTTHPVSLPRELDPPPLLRSPFPLSTQSGVGTYVPSKTPTSPHFTSPHIVASLYIPPQLSTVQIRSISTPDPTLSLHTLHRSTTYTLPIPPRRKPQPHAQPSTLNISTPHFFDSPSPTTTPNQRLPPPRPAR